MKTKPPAKGTQEKRRREDDIPLPIIDTKHLAETQAFKQLEATIKCEAHKGHCLVDHTGGRDNHRRLNFVEMTQWAQKIVSKIHVNMYVNSPKFRHLAKQQYIPPLTSTDLIACRPRSLKCQVAHPKSM